MDHVPPKALFPKPDEAPGYRSGLITVPACAQHNMSRSHDDEYFTAVIVSCTHDFRPPAPMRARIHRGFMRRGGSLAKRFMSRSTPTTYRGMATGAHQLEHPRIDRVLKATAHGLIWHEHGLRLGSELMIAAYRGPFANKSDGGIDPFRSVRELAALDDLLDRHGVPVRGEHDDSFWFQCLENPPVVLMTFYSELQFFALMPGWATATEQD